MKSNIQTIENLNKILEIISKAGGIRCKDIAASMSLEQKVVAAYLTRLDNEQKVYRKKLKTGNERSQFCYWAKNPTPDKSKMVNMLVDFNDDKVNITIKTNIDQIYDQIQNLSLKDAEALFSRFTLKPTFM